MTPPSQNPRLSERRYTSDDVAAIPQGTIIPRVPHITGAQRIAPFETDCEHESLRGGGSLDDHCLRCGADGYWHEGQRLDEAHPSGKVLFRLPKAAPDA